MQDLYHQPHVMFEELQLRATNSEIMQLASINELVNMHSAKLNVATEAASQ